MKLIIPKKQVAKNSDFVNAWQNIERLVSYDEARTLIASTVSEIRKRTRGMNVGYAWSGGKDSLALQYVCEQAGIHKCALCTAHELEYPEFRRWVSHNAPFSLKVYDIRSLSMEWLSDHQDWLFPADAKMSSKWMAKLQYYGQHLFYQNEHLDCIILGRRSQDGNFVGRGTNMYTTKDGEIHYNPIASWKHEQVMAVIHYFMKDNLPWVFYNSRDGWTKGTGLWPEREYSWQEVYEIDKEVVLKASMYFKSARDFLATKHINIWHQR